MSKKKRYRIRNWAQYNKALVKRGSLTLWFEEESIKKWHKAGKKKGRGRPPKYADIAIQCMLTLKSVFNLPLRATQGLVASLIEWLLLPIEAADYSTVCRRQKKLEIPLIKRNQNEPLHGVFDSTGLKVFGDGEVLSDLLEQIDSPLSQASADGAYDSFENYELLSERGAKITIPPRENAKIHQHGNCKASPLVRDEIVRAIRKLDRAEWKRQSGYHRRSLAETTMFRCFATLTMTEDFWR